MSDVFISIGHAATLIGVCTKTLRRWDAEGSFSSSFRTTGGHRRYDRIKVLSMTKRAMLKKTESKPEGGKNAVIYGRVSSSKQKKRGDLDRQLENMRDYCLEKGYMLQDEFSDVGSGLNDRRTGLHKMLGAVANGICDVVVVHYQDRLARFGIRVIKRFLSSWGVRLEIVQPTVDDSSPHSELITDLTAILYSFMGRLYRSRRGKKKQQHENHKCL